MKKILLALLVLIQYTIMPAILSRPMTAIVSPPSSFKSRRNRVFGSPSDRKARGITGRNTVGKLIGNKASMDHNQY